MLCKVNVPYPVNMEEGKRKKGEESQERVQGQRKSH